MKMNEYESDALEIAIEIAMQFHKWRKDMNGEPYILHLLRVMMKMGTFEEKLVRVLHDIEMQTGGRTEGKGCMGYEISF